MLWGASASGNYLLYEVADGGWSVRTFVSSEEVLSASTGASLAGSDDQLWLFARGMIRSQRNGVIEETPSSALSALQHWGPARSLDLADGALTGDEVRVTINYGTPSEAIVRVPVDVRVGASASVLDAIPFLKRLQSRERVYYHRPTSATQSKTDIFSSSGLVESIDGWRDQQGQTLEGAYLVFGSNDATLVSADKRIVNTKGAVVAEIDGTIGALPMSQGVVWVNETDGETHYLQLSPTRLPVERSATIPPMRDAIWRRFATDQGEVFFNSETRGRNPRVTMRCRPPVP